MKQSEWEKHFLNEVEYTKHLQEINKDLLEACKMVRMDHNYDKLSQASRNDIEIAIAKVEGK